MQDNRLSVRLLALTAFTVLLFATGTYAQQENVLYTFLSNGKDGFDPRAGLTFDNAGNLYGTTYEGGHGQGAVFELSPVAGGWTESVLYSFHVSGKSGSIPLSGVIFDAAGNLYGTTLEGGDVTKCSGFGCGTVFELTPEAGGGWTEKWRHNFGSNSKDGMFPMAGLISDAAGNLYGTTNRGGAHGQGTVFELTPKAGGGWTEKVLYGFFVNNGKDGAFPQAGLIFDTAGNLYGTTSGGGAHHQGTVFELTPKVGGGWTERLLYSFFANHGKDGAFPQAGLILDAAGNLYGTTKGGGAYGFAKGTVFELSPVAGGGWSESVLYNFGKSSDGKTPTAGLIFDAAGNLYGTTLDGGTHDSGTVFELTPVAGSWTERVLHSFSQDTGDGYWPFAGLIFDATGNLYGTASAGGANNFGGTVFEITP
jgi:uncharacterized repeat protein (TIGR03803 family)